MYYLLTDKNDIITDLIIDDDFNINSSNGISMHYALRDLYKRKYSKKKCGNFIKSFKNYWRCSYIDVCSMYIRCILTHNIKNNKIILGDRYYLFDPRTIKKFNLIIDESFINAGCVAGDTNFLEWWHKSNMPLKYNELALMYASCNGHINVLEWWYKSNLPLKYNTDAMGYASSYGHVSVLEWWCKSNLPLKYNTDHALYNASLTGHVNVLTWWLKSNLPLEYDGKVLDVASSRGRINVLEWWKNSGLELKYTDNASHYAYTNGHMNVLEWFINNNLTVPFHYKLKYNIFVIKKSFSK